MRCVLAVDIGGTKTLFQLSTEQGESLFKLRLESQPYASFDDILAEFLAQPEVQCHTISTACFAIAGPVNGEQASVTKLPWKLSIPAIEKTFGFSKVIFCNDFEAVGYGVACLTASDIETLYPGQPSPEHANRAVMGAGTGLGQAIIISQDDDWRVLPTEGGHVDFAPTDRAQVLLLEHLQSRFAYVPYDRIVCGSGIEIIYHFLRDYQQIEESAELRMALLHADAAATISDFALNKRDPLSVQTMKLFFKIYGAQAGNFALLSLARGGLYLAGGIAAKNLDLIKHSEFVTAFLNKGPMRHVVESVPVHVVLDYEIGLKGALQLALKAL